MREDWDIRLFKDVFDLQMGKTPDRKNFSLFEGDNTWVSIKDLDGKYISSSKECISDEAAKNIKLVKRGTVIMSFKLTIGKTAIAGKDLYTNEAIMAFNLRNGYDIDASFLYYYLKNYRWEGSNKAVMGITLNKATISKHKIAIPPKPTQLSIVSELDKLNELIRIKKEQLKDYDALAQSIFYEMFGDPMENEKGWEVKALGEVSTYPKERIAINQICPNQYIGVENLIKDRGGVRFSDNLPKADVAIAYKENDILLGNIRPYLKKIWLADKVGGASGDVVIIRIKERSISPLFLFKLLSSDQFFEYDNTHTKGAKMPRGDRKVIAKFGVILPPLSLQQSFTQKIEQIEQQKVAIQKTITDLETLLAARMQYWFD